MAIRVSAIIERKFAEDTTTTQYTATGVQCIIDKLTATNTSGSAVTLTVHLVPAAAGTDNSNAVGYQKSIPAGGVELFAEVVGQVLEPGDHIDTIASTGGVLVLSAAGREIA